MNDHSEHRIGAAASAVGVSVDTLRYYEKIGLVPRPSRTAAGTRLYGEKDLARLRFVKRAQGIGFSLDEIAKLLRFREQPTKCSDAVRTLAGRKYEHLRAQRREIQKMEQELRLLLSLCRGSADECPILQELEAEGRSRKRQRS
jgi:DNA-binding transcriptional MerR regulator